MYNIIEKEYKKLGVDNKFNKFYWASSIIISLIFIVLSNFFPYVENYIYIIFLLIIIISYTYICCEINKTPNINDKKMTFKEKVFLYRKYQEEKMMNDLILLLEKNGVKSKTNIKLLIDYYNKKIPLKIETGILGWLIPVSVAISSLFEIAYDSETKTIDSGKIVVIFGSTIGIILIIAGSILLLKWCIDTLRLPKNKIYENLAEDLTKIYFNFDKYIESNEI